jgi:SAM-dependent methyltransferase
MTKFFVEYGKSGSPPPLPDGRLDAPPFHRNHDAIWSAIARFLNGLTGNVLELGSGTGQHAVTFAQRAPELTWWPSDIYESHLNSIAAWKREMGVTNLQAPQRIDLTDPDWRWESEGANGGPFTAMLCINVLHISPWVVSKNLISGAGRFLGLDGKLFIYGSFMRDGVHNAPSNAAFDASLRAENPEWGVRDMRDLSELAKAHGLMLDKTVPMPADNWMLVFARAARQM